MAIKINGDNSTSAVGLNGGDDDSGVKPGTNQVEIVTGGTARITAENATTTISNNLSVTGTSAFTGTTTLGNNKIEANTSGRLKIQRDLDTSAALLITNAAGSVNQHIFYPNGTITLVNGKVGIDTNGNIDLRAAGGNLSFDAGKGINFADTTDGSGMSSELFDDYEEGSWTPIDSSGESLSLTASGRYTKSGNLLFCTFDITYPTQSGSNNAKVAGLPFAASTTNLQGSGSIAWTNFGSAITFYMGSFTNSFGFNLLSNTSQTGRTNAHMSGKRVIGSLTIRTD